MIVAVLGSGNMQTAADVAATLASVAAYEQLEGRSTEIRLFDPNEERLDLVHRLISDLLGETTESGTLIASTSLTESVEGATFVIWTLHEDCLRRLALPVSPMSTEDDANDPNELRRGDPNRPTPLRSLSQATIELIGSREGEADFEGLVLHLRAECEQIAPRAKHISTSHSHTVPDSQSISWPQGVPDHEVWRAPHQILRWLLADEPLKDLIKRGDDNPLYGILTAGR